MREGFTQANHTNTAQQLYPIFNLWLGNREAIQYHINECMVLVHGPLLTMGPASLSTWYSSAL